MDRRGFTLIEVLVVLIIMAVLVGTAVTSLSAGLKSARMRDAARAVQQYVRHAKAVALLKQRPVVITFEEIVENGEFVKSRLSLDYSGDAQQERGATPLGNGFMTGGGGVQTLSGQTVGEPAAPAAAGTAELPAEDPLAAPPREFEGIHIRGTQHEEEQRARISIFSNVDVLRGKAASEKKKAAPEKGRDEDPEAKDEEQTFSAVYEANGRCDPYEIHVWKAGDDEASAMKISVSRFGRAVTEE